MADLAQAIHVAWIDRGVDGSNETDVTLSAEYEHAEDAHEMHGEMRGRGRGLMLASERWERSKRRVLPDTRILDSSSPFQKLSSSF